MDFFTRQDDARKKTKWLVLYFTLSVLCTILFIYLAFALIFLRGQAEEVEGLAWLWNGTLFAAVAAGTLLVILLGNIYKISTLSKGGAHVASLLGGQPVDANTADPDERKLLNVVEEMAIASGTPVPDVYLLRREEGINAFAAGNSTQDAAIGVTRGCVQLLSRDELQGVIAHEFSHVLNGDMRLNIRLIGIVHGLVCIAMIGRILLFSGRRHHHRHRHYMLGARSRGKGGNPLPLIGLALLVIGGIGILFGRLIKSAVSRQREFLADASAVQFTRNPSGLGGALKKIGGLTYGSRLETARAEEASHMFFGNGLKPSWLKGFSTHPPLPDRIRAIDPQFDGTFPPVQPPESRTPSGEAPPKKEGKPRTMGMPPVIPLPGVSQLLGDQAPSPAPAPGRTPAPTASANVMSHVGAPNASHLDFAVQMMASLPPPVSTAARDPSGALALVYLLLLSSDSQEQARQKAELQQRLAAPVLEEVQRLGPAMESLPKEFRLPLAELTLPALRRLSPAQYQQFRDTMQWLVESDAQLDLFEFALQKMVQRHLQPHFQPVKRRALQYYSLKPLLTDIQVLASTLAHVGQEEPDQITQAYARGLQRLPADHRNLDLLPLDQCRLDAIDQALDKLSQASPRLKKVLLEVCVETVTADGELQSREGELLRAIADSLDCPMPPLMAAPASS